MIMLVLAFAILVLIEVPKLIKKKHWRELIVFSVILALAFVTSIYQLKDIEIPNPVRDTQYFVKSLFPFGYD